MKTCYKCPKIYNYELYSILDLYLNYVFYFSTTEMKSYDCHKLQIYFYTNFVIL